MDMNSTAKDEARAIFVEHQGVLRMREAQKLGIHPQTLARLLEEGSLVRPARGLYMLSDAARPMEDTDLVQVAKLVPKAVFCLLTALSLHELTTQIPRIVYCALPRAAWKPRLPYPPLDVTWLSEKAYEAGIETRSISGVGVALYSPEKTVADLFKFRSKMGEDVALEALQEYMRSPKRDLDRLLHFAAIDRVRNIMEPYLKALA
jgi:predicted transcriptional regulator of viral defense system